LFSEQLEKKINSQPGTVEEYIEKAKSTTRAIVNGLKSEEDIKAICEAFPGIEDCIGIVETTEFPFWLDVDTLRIAHVEAVKVAAALRRYRVEAQGQIPWKSLVRVFQQPASFWVKVKNKYHKRVLFEGIVEPFLQYCPKLLKRRFNHVSYD
jgi:hypothetical protein